MLKLIKCEFLKLKRKPLVFISVFLSTLLPLAYAIFLADANTDVDATNNMMSGLFQLSAYLLLMPLLVILASNLLFEELDNDTLKNLVTIPVNRTKLVLSKMIGFTDICHWFYGGWSVGKSCCFADPGMESGGILEIVSGRDRRGSDYVGRRAPLYFDSCPS